MKIGLNPFQPIVPKLDKKEKVENTEEVAVVPQVTDDPKNAVKKIVQQQISEIEEARTDMGEDDPKAQQIIAKFKSGKKLSPEEMAYLRIHAPGMVGYIERIMREREIIELSMKMSRTKTDVQMVALSSAKQIEKCPNPEEREIRAKQLADAKHEYEKTDEYKEKPNSPLDKEKKHKKIRYKQNKQQTIELAKIAYKRVKTQKRENTIEYDQ